MMSAIKEHRIILCIMAAAFILSLAYSFHFRITPAVDAAAYDHIAWNLVSGNGYKEYAELSYSDDLAIIRVGPGYEFFLAGIYFLFGHHYEAAWIINALLHALSALLVFLTAREIFKETNGSFIGVVAALFIALSPDLITMSGMLMTETLGVFLIALSVYLFWRYVNSVAKPVWLLSIVALAFGFAVMVRTPAALLFLPFAYYLIREKQRRYFLIFTAILILLFMPWISRNYSVHHVFIPTNLAFGYDLLAGNHPGATGELEPYPLNDEFMRQGRIEGNKMALKTAIGFISAHPAEFLKITLDRISIYFSFARPTGFWFHLHGFAKAATLALSAIYSVLLFTLGFLGAYGIKVMPPEDKKRARLFLAMLVMMPLSVIWIIVETRYRFLIYPFFAVFAGYGLQALFDKKISWRALFGIFGILFLNTAFDAGRNLDRIIERIGEFL